jgi:hypothetical protein
MWCTPIEDTTTVDTIVTCYVPEDINSHFAPTEPATVRSVIEMERIRVTTVLDDDDSDEDSISDDDSAYNDGDTTDDYLSAVTIVDLLDDNSEDNDYSSTDDDDSDGFTDDESAPDDDWSIPIQERTNTLDLLSPEVQEDLQHPPQDDEFFDAVEFPIAPMVYKGIEYFDCMTEPEPVCPILGQPSQPRFWPQQIARSFTSSRQSLDLKPVVECAANVVHAHYHVYPSPGWYSHAS